MIKGAHLTIFTPDAEALRAFFRDKLGLPFSDAGGGWLIFDLPPAEVGCHSLDEEGSSQAGSNTTASQELSFICDDIHETVSFLKKRGVQFTADVSDAGYGLVAPFLMPGVGEAQLYQPKYEKKSTR
jgi:catechol 2,3-dioxygenase-like lactoylglutathione lyase family enzyme